MKELIIKHRSKNTDDYHGYYYSFHDFDANEGLSPTNILDSSSPLGNGIYGPFKSKSSAIKNAKYLFEI